MINSNMASSFIRSSCLVRATFHCADLSGVIIRAQCSKNAVPNITRSQFFWLGNAFDLTWLTVACIKLKEIREGKIPRVRVKGLR